MHTEFSKHVIWTYFWQCTKIIVNKEWARRLVHSLGAKIHIWGVYQLQFEGPARISAIKKLITTICSCTRGEHSSMLTVKEIQDISGMRFDEIILFYYVPGIYLSMVP